MAKLRFCSLRESLNMPHDTLDARVADATETLLRAIRTLDDLAKPKHFVFTDAYLRQFEQLPSDESRHGIRVISPPDEAVDEIAEWQVFGEIAGRIVNVIIYGVFHTYIKNRSGTHEYFINGKEPNYKPEFGGVTIDDVWQDTGKYKEFYEAVGRHIYNTRRGL